MNFRKQKTMLRYGPGTRANHWAMAGAFILLALSGLAFFHPPFFFFTDMLGGPVWSRILHPFIGVVLFVLFVIIAVRQLKYNLLMKNDVQWMRQMGDVLNNRDEKLPPIGKYNPGQKMVYWALILCIPVLLITGVIMWRPWFAGFFPIPLIRVASLVHALAAFIAIATIIVHVYAAIWVKGSIKAMTRGRVTHAWAKHHHPLWYEEEMKDPSQRAGDENASERDTTSHHGDRHDSRTSG
ncbi:formate dehydrogenase subunit gamma [Kushneria phyllosphaerae]|uniref:Formate dehydrogenase, cytochrome b556(Fdo) subunit n=1 Tax=Kushneria phyllosphaerae TaxID=2100822 RepID=A0A2R8CGM4_9GAMM|nr:formate dehydrogenase subunit gamma [Kushneria phyllosphaerae]SPJ32013.1 Formate dehydrogenase, cytochrome b556(fdo) subunit [Kushneria phyllosphaerae]